MTEGLNIFWIALIVTAALVVLGALNLLRTRYKRCPANRVLVIYGWPNRGEAARCIHGGAKFVLPLVQEYAYMTLEPIQIEVPLRAALSMENIRVDVPSVFTVAIGTTPELMQNAAVRLLGLEISEIKKQAEDMIFGQLRQVIASMKIEDINRDRDKFLESIQSSLDPELRKIGLLLINVNITDITDESGYIEAIGRNAASMWCSIARGARYRSARPSKSRGRCPLRHWVESRPGSSSCAGRSLKLLLRALCPRNIATLPPCWT